LEYYTNQIEMKEDKKLNSIFRTYPELKLVYLFGSMATGSEGPLSDYDFAIYLDTKDKTRIYEIKADMIVRIGKLLKTDSIDVVILNLTDNPVLRYMIIKEGRLIYEKEPFKVILEPIILNEYFDFQKMLTKHN
ncbi:MAG: type VII toxin-antitoxin system MntA family adenylyltransferase antitoxin, partial [bacterium]